MENKFQAQDFTMFSEDCMQFAIFVVISNYISTLVQIYAPPALYEKVLFHGLTNKACYQILHFC